MCAASELYLIHLTVHLVLLHMMVSDIALASEFVRFALDRLFQNSQPPLADLPVEFQ